MSDATAAPAADDQAGDEREAIDAEVVSEPEAPPVAEQQRALAVQEKPEAPVPFELEHTGHAFRLATQLAKSDLVPSQLQGKPSNVFLVLLRGHELGLSPTQALGAINVIDGKTVDSAQLMIARVMRDASCEYFRCVESSELGATWACRRVGWPDGVEDCATFTIEDAKRAGLYDKGKTQWAKENNNWHRWPEEMCSWRAASKLAKRCFPDITLGMDAAEGHEIRATAAIEATYSERASAPPAGVQAPPAPAADDGELDEVEAEKRRLESAIELAADMDELRRLHEDVKRLPKPDQGALVKLMGERHATISQAQGGAA